MAEVDLTINGRTYQIACDDGQEAHIADLARYVDGRLRELVEALGQVGEARLLLMTCLLIADELHDAYRELDALAASRGTDREADDAAEMLDNCARRLEAIAARLEGA